MKKKSAEENRPLDRKIDKKALVVELNKRLAGEAIITMGEDIPNPFKERMSTGSIGLDSVIGGGIPRGGLVQYIGMEGSGKTTMAIKAAVEVQKKFGEESSIAYVGVEGPLDLSWAKKIGVDPSIGTLVNVSASNAELYLTAVEEIVNSNEFQLVILDSIPALLTSAESDANFGDPLVAVVARLLSRFCKKCVWGAKAAHDGTPNKTSILAINQFRSKIGGFSPTGAPMEQSGGNAIKYAKLLDIHFKSGSQINKGGVSSEEGKKNKIIIGKEIKYLIGKGKAGCHEGGSGQFNLYFEDIEGTKAGQIDIGNEYRLVGQIHGVFLPKGAYIEYEGQNYRHADIEQMVNTDLNFREKIRDEILKKVKGEENEREAV